jgi:F-type H+-transporting ATPase subunit epsilon
MKSFSLKMETPDRVFFDGEAEFLSIKTSDGSYGVLADHAPAVAKVTRCIAEITVKSEKIRVAVMGGVMEIGDNKVTVLGDFIERVEDADRVLKEREDFIRKESERRKQSYEEFRHNSIALKKAIRKLGGDKTIGD